MFNDLYLINYDQIIFSGLILCNAISNNQWMCGYFPITYKVIRIFSVIFLMIMIFPYYLLDYQDIFYNILDHQDIFLYPIWLLWYSLITYRIIMVFPCNLLGY